MDPFLHLDLIPEMIGEVFLELIHLKLQEGLSLHYSCPSGVGFALGELVLEVGDLSLQ